MTISDARIHGVVAVDRASTCILMMAVLCCCLEEEGDVNGRRLKAKNNIRNIRNGLGSPERASTSVPLICSKTNK